MNGKHGHRLRQKGHGRNRRKLQAMLTDISLGKQKWNQRLTKKRKEKENSGPVGNGKEEAKNKKNNKQTNKQTKEAILSIGRTCRINVSIAIRNLSKRLVDGRKGIRNPIVSFRAKEKQKKIIIKRRKKERKSCSTLTPTVISSLKIGDSVEQALF